MDKISKYIEDNYQYIETFKDLGFLNDSDIKILLNANDEYTYDEQKGKFNELVDLVKMTKDLMDSDDEDDKTFVKETLGLLNANEEINADDWMDYDQDEMAQLAEQMGYNWKNPTDRSNMMQRLQDKAIRREKVKAYEEDKKNSPINTFITEMFLPNTTARLSKGEDVKGRDYVLDALNSGMMIVPSFDGKKLTGTLLGADVVQSVGTGFNTGAVDADFLNDKVDLGLAVGFPLVGNAASKSTDLLKNALDLVKGTIEATPIGGKILDGVADPILDALEDTKLTARKNAKKDIAEYNKYSKYNQSVYDDVDRRYPLVDLAKFSLEHGLIKTKNLLNRLFDSYTNRTGAVPHDPQHFDILKERADIAQDALDYLDERPRFHELSDEHREKATEFLLNSGMKHRGSRGKEFVQGLAKSVSKPLIEGLGSKRLYRDDAIEEKNELIKKRAEEIVKNKAGDVYNYYKGRDNDLTEEEIEILQKAEVL